MSATVPRLLALASATLVGLSALACGSAPATGNAPDHIPPSAPVAEVPGGVAACASSGIVAVGGGGPTRRAPVQPPVNTGLPMRAGVSGEIACPVFVEGDTVDIRCDGDAAAAVRAASGDWYASTGPDGLLIWVKEGKVTAAVLPPGVHWSELGGRVLPTAAEASGASRCSVRLLVGADGVVLAARARKECPSIGAAEGLAMTAHFDPPCIEGGPWPVQVDIPVSVP